MPCPIRIRRRKSPRKPRPPRARSPRARRKADALRRRRKIRAVTADVVHELSRAARRGTQRKSPTGRRPRANNPTKTPRATQSDMKRFRKDFYKLTNTIRVAHKLKPLTNSASLTRIAKAHTRDQAFNILKCTHEGSDGSSMSDRLRRGGYRYRRAGENVAHGQVNPQHALHSLMGSPGHRKNILNPDYSHTGVYVMIGADGRLFWTQLFSTPR